MKIETRLRTNLNIEINLASLEMPPQMLNWVLVQDQDA